MAGAAARDSLGVSMFDRIGGAEAVDRLVETFYARISALPEARRIHGMHPDDLGPVKAVLKRYLGEWLGGPKLYSAEKGHPRLRQRHLPFPIGAEDRDAWLLCMRGALESSVADAQARKDIYDDLAKLADWMRNDPGNPHDARASSKARLR